MNMQQSRSIRSFGRGAQLTLALAFLALTAAPAARAAAEASAVPEAAVEATPIPVTSYERVRSSGRIALGYLSDARPFSYRDEAGKAAGFAVGVCARVAEQLKADLGLSALAVDWVPVTEATRFEDVQRGRVDLLCSGESVTLTGRASVSYSIAIFENGIGALMNVDGSDSLRAALEERRPPYKPLWRGTRAPALDRRTFAVVAGTPTVDWLADRVQVFGLVSTVTTTDDYDAGVANVLSGKADALFGDRAALLDAAKRSASPDDLVVLARLYRFQPIALAMARGDDDFRLAVDRALTHVYASPDFGTLYADLFGEADPETVAFYRVTALPE